MQPLIQQLKRVRSRARIMLLVMRAAGWLTIVLAAAMSLGLIDFVLRLPSWLRLVVVVVAATAVVYDGVRRLAGALRVRPGLTTLALRLERMYPEASGRIASAVAFATEPHPETDSPLSRQLAASATAGARGVLQPRQVNRLLEPAYLMRTLLAMFMVMGVFTVAAVAAPQHVATAFSRWTQPFGDAAWPNRYRVESLTDQAVAPNNAPLRVAARVTKGDHDTLRTWVVYKFVKPDQNPTDVPWQRALMTRQVDSGVEGEYRRPIEPMPAADRMVYHFEAGDDATPSQVMQLIQPPTVRRAVAQVDPPAYAAGQIPVERHDLLQPPRPSVVLDALAGSRVRLQLTVDGSFQQLGSDADADADRLHDWVARNFPGLVDPDAPAAAARSITYAAMPAEAVTQFELSFVLRDPTQFRFNLTDAYGTSYEDQRVFRFEVRPDRAPRVAVIEPAADQSVLATAVIALAAEAQDDVAIDRARLETRRPEHAPNTLAESTAPDTRTRLSATLDLAPLELEPGDELAVLAIAEDNYQLDGERHDPVESAARRLRIISDEEFTRQLRMDLAELRQRTIRARGAQQRLIESEANPQTARRQRDMLERINTLSRSLNEIRDRMRLNRMDNQRLAETTDQARKLLDEASRSAESAATDMQRATRGDQDPQAAESEARARAQQQRTAEQLDELVKRLDQGRDMYELKQKLTKLQVDQDQLAEQVRKTLPQTLGKTAEQLTEAQRQQLQQMRDQQQSLAEQARQLTQRMRSAAAAIQRQSEKPEDQANAEALRQAADTATREKLEQKMDDAAERTGENQLSQAQTQQQQASQTISRMLQDMGRAEQLRQQILQRKLMELVEAIQKLRDQQKAQLDRLNAAQALANLDGPLLTLRRNTMSVAETARAAGDALIPVAKLLDGAAADQAAAVDHLRQADPLKADVADAETAALAKLDQALKLAREQADKAQQEMTEQEREKLIKQYKALKAEQEGIRGATEPLASKPDDQRDRRFRAASIELGNRQADLRVAMKQLEEKVAKTIVYKAVHQQIDRWAGHASTRLRNAEPAALVVIEQRMIESSIQSLIDALKPPDPDKEFAEQPGDGGGGGGAGGGPQPLIPDIAEVVLLRTRQVQVHDMTRTVDQGAVDLSADQRGPVLDHLAQQQSDLAQTGNQLIQSLSNRNIDATNPLDLQDAPKPTEAP